MVIIIILFSKSLQFLITSVFWITEIPISQPLIQVYIGTLPNDRTTMGTTCNGSRVPHSCNFSFKLLTLFFVSILLFTNSFIRWYSTRSLQFIYNYDFGSSGLIDDIVTQAGKVGVVPSIIIIIAHHRVSCSSVGRASD